MRIKVVTCSVKWVMCMPVRLSVWHVQDQQKDYNVKINKYDTVGKFVRSADYSSLIFEGYTLALEKCVTLMIYAHQWFELAQKVKLRQAKADC